MKYNVITRTRFYTGLNHISYLFLLHKLTAWHRIHLQKLMDGQLLYSAGSKLRKFCPLFGDVSYTVDSAIGNAVSRRLLTAETRILTQGSLCGICGGQSGTGTCLSPSHSVFTCSIFTRVSCGGWTMGLVAAQFHRDNVLTHRNNDKLHTTVQSVSQSVRPSVLAVGRFALRNFAHMNFCKKPRTLSLARHPNANSIILNLPNKIEHVLTKT
jgi:hypothetical protein